MPADNVAAIPVCTRWLVTWVSFGTLQENTVEFPHVRAPIHRSWMILGRRNRTTLDRDSPPMLSLPVA